MPTLAPRVRVGLGRAGLGLGCAIYETQTESFAILEAIIELDKIYEVSENPFINLAVVCLFVCLSVGPSICLSPTQLHVSIARPSKV